MGTQWNFSTCLRFQQNFVNHTWTTRTNAILDPLRVRRKIVPSGDDESETRSGFRLIICIRKRSRTSSTKLKASYPRLGPISLRRTSARLKLLIKLTLYDRKRYEAYKWNSSWTSSSRELVLVERDSFRGRATKFQ